MSGEVILYPGASGTATNSNPVDLGSTISIWGTLTMNKGTYNVQKGNGFIVRPQGYRTM